VSTRLRLAGAVLLAALASLSLAPRALAQAYRATFVAQCCYATLESGEVAGGQFFEFRNIGTQTWTAPTFRLGVSEPYGRISAFRHSSWLNDIRPATLSVQAVAPGQIGRFNFTVKAPSVAVTTVFRESFEPVMEYVSWAGQHVFLDYTVLPSLPPTVGFTSVPAQLARGALLDVAVEATDNRAVERVEFTVGGQSVSATTPDPADGRTFAVHIPTADLPAGPQSVIARAVDRVGNFATTTANFTIAVPPGSVPSDRDGDGVLDTTDCDDTNSAVRPGAAEVPGNGRDDDCSGGDAPGRVTATVQNNWTSTRTYSRITILKAKGVPAGATIETRCRGRGCPFKLRTLAVAKAGDVDLRKRYFRKSKLRVGAVLEIRVLAPNSIGKVARFTVRERKTPRSSYLCLAPGATKPAACT